MKITNTQLKAQFDRVIKDAWLDYFIAAADIGDTTTAHFLGIGSRETNLKNIRGDFRNGKYNGFGPLQVDIGTDPEYAARWTPRNVEAGIIRGAEIYQSKVKDFNFCVGKKVKVRSKLFTGRNGDSEDRRRVATAAYNCGRWAHYHFSNFQHVDSTTTGKDYSRDVYDRAIYFAALLEGYKITGRADELLLVKVEGLAATEKGALEKELNLQGKYASPEHLALINRASRRKISSKLPKAEPQEDELKLDRADYGRTEPLTDEVESREIKPDSIGVDGPEDPRASGPNEPSQYTPPEGDPNADDDQPDQTTPAPIIETEPAPPAAADAGTEQQTTATIDATGAATIQKSETQLNEQNVNEDVFVNEPKPQGFLRKLGAGIVSLLTGTALFEGLAKYNGTGLGLSWQITFIICFIIFLAFVGFCVWYIVDSRKQDKRVEVKALVDTDPKRKNLVYIPHDANAEIYKKIATEKAERESRLKAAAAAANFVKQERARENARDNSILGL